MTPRPGVQVARPGTGPPEPDRTPAAAALPTAAAGLDTAVLDAGPPGDRYFRHPGDLVRLVVFGAALCLLALAVRLAPATSRGWADDLGRAAARPPEGFRQGVLAVGQLALVAAPVLVALALVGRRRWRRLGTVILATTAGIVAQVGIDHLLDLPGRPAGAVTGGTWLASASFPSAAVLAGAVAGVAVGKPWLGRAGRRAADLALALLVGLMVVAASSSGPALVIAGVVGAFVGAAVLLALGAPNRRPDLAAVEAALRQAGLDVARLQLLRGRGGRSQLFEVVKEDGGRAFVKLSGRDSRDSDLLYRAYRLALLRAPGDGPPATSPTEAVEHEALMCLLARRAGVDCPAMEALAALEDGSAALVLDHVDGRPLEALPPGAVDADLLDATWRQVRRLHGAGLAHRSLRAANILVVDTPAGPDGAAAGAGPHGTGCRPAPVLAGLGSARASAPSRLLAVDRAELLISLATLVGAEAAVASASRVLAPADLAAAMPYLQPLALSAATRKHASKSLLSEVRAAVARVTGEEPAPLERLVRVQPRTAIMVVALAAAFYVLLPQLAQVGDSVNALRDARWDWLGATVALSIATYVASAVALSGGVAERLPYVPTLAAQLASSFVNRVTPAKVGGLALNVRYLQKAGVPPAGALTGIGLNLLAGGIVHTLLTIGFVTAAGRSGDSGFRLPSGSTNLVVIVVVLAVAGVVAATRRGRRLVRTHVVRFVRQSWSSLSTLATRPRKLVALVLGSVGVTLAYAGALAAALAAFEAGVGFSQVASVYLGSSIIASAAPTPGGLGAMEAALVAGLTGVGVDGGVAVAAVLSYRLATYWLPVLPGWVAFQLLERRNIL